MLWTLWDIWSWSGSVYLVYGTFSSAFCMTINQSWDKRWGVQESGKTLIHSNLGSTVRAPFEQQLTTHKGDALLGPRQTEQGTLTNRDKPFQSTGHTSCCCRPCRECTRTSWNPPSSPNGNETHTERRNERSKHASFHLPWHLKSLFFGFL